MAEVLAARPSSPASPPTGQLTYSGRVTAFVFLTKLRHLLLKDWKGRVGVRTQQKQLPHPSESQDFGTKASENILCKLANR